MADVVQYRLEESLPEIQEMKEMHLFEESELRQIIKRRTDYEYRVQRTDRVKDDYTKYIEYEMNLYTLIKVKCKRLGSNTNPKSVLGSIGQRIKRLYTQAVVRCRHDVGLWQCFIDFSKQLKWKALTSNTYTDLLKVHGDKPELWIDAANWEYQTNRQMQPARKLLMKGLRFNPSSKSLYLAMFDLELQFIEHERKYWSPKQESTVPEAITSGAVANTVYQNALKAITDVSFIKSFIQICQKYYFSSNLEKSMYRDLIVKFPTDEIAWETVACRSITNWNVKRKGEHITFEHMKECFMIYDIAVKTVNTDKMWSLYIQFCRNQLQKDEIVDKTRIQKKLLEIFSNACESNHLSAEEFMQWYQLSASDGRREQIETILSVALTRYPQNYEAWKMKIVATMKKGKSAEITDVLGKAMSSVDPKDSFDILSLAIRWYTSVGEDDKVKQLYEDTLAMPANVSARLKVDYLEWMAKTSGVKAAFKLFRRIWSMSPVCKEIMYRMCELELSKLKPSMGKIHEIMEYAIKNFGKSDVDIWIYFVKLERQHSDEISGVAKIHSRAIRMLEPQLVDQFITHYTLLTTMASS